MFRRLLALLAAAGVLAGGPQECLAIYLLLKSKAQGMTYAIRTGDATILFDTGISPRAVPGLRYLREIAAACLLDAGITEVHDSNQQRQSGAKR